MQETAAEGTCLHMTSAEPYVSGEYDKNAQSFRLYFYEIWQTAENAKRNKKICEKGCLFLWVCGIINYVWDFARFDEKKEEKGMYDLQRASLWKRLSAALFDAILLAIAAVGIALLLSTVLGYSQYTEQMEAAKTRLEAEYGLDFDISLEEYEALPETKKELYNQANEAYGKDPDANRAYSMMFNLSLIITTFSILAAFLLLEFLVPLLLRNGQTLGKKIFGVGVMRIDGVKLPPVLLFARTVLGKYTIGTMIPVYVIIMIYFHIMGIFGTVIIGALLLVQMILLFGTRNHTAIHDKLSQTVTVDLASQLIFDTPEALLAYKKRIHAEEVKSRE